MILADFLLIRLDIDLERSTMMFSQLADPNGHNNPLSQVLYGLALRYDGIFMLHQFIATLTLVRHGWGCTKDEARAVTYLSAAATNSAAVESEALRAGMKKGGSAKGELVLAIFELANCFRMGWGVKKDPAAARQYYETAANLGDTDAMDQVAWCYLEGFGGKKDKV
jgi:TPR repeat protein